MKITAEDGIVYEYHVDKNSYELGYSLATMPITEKIKSKLFPLTNNDIQQLEKYNDEDYEQEFGNDDEFSFEIWPLSTENMVGNYYDKDGFLYYFIEHQLYKFKFRLNYFKKLYEDKINAT